MDYDMSVILPVYNQEKFIKESLLSLLNQRNIQLEVIILDNGSTDKTRSEVEKLKVRNLRYLYLPNLNLGEILNIGMDECKSEIIARQDGDDISHNMRLCTQMRYLANNKKLVAVGTWAWIIDEMSKIRGKITHPIWAEAVEFKLNYGSPLVHSSVVMKKSAVKASGGYANQGLGFPEDYDLWTRLIKFGQIENVPYFLQKYRKSSNSITSKFSREIQNETKKIARIYLVENYRSKSVKRTSDIEFMQIQSTGYINDIKDIISIYLINRNKFKTMYQLFKVLGTLSLKKILRKIL